MKKSFTFNVNIKAAFLLYEASSDLCEKSSYYSDPCDRNYCENALQIHGKTNLNSLRTDGLRMMHSKDFLCRIRADIALCWRQHEIQF